MSGEEQTPPIRPIGSERVDPIRRWRRRRRWARGEEDAQRLDEREQQQRRPTPMQEDHRPRLGAEAEHERLEHPVDSPDDVDQAASVHDAAAHGSRIAKAIEAARRARRGRPRD